MWSVMYENRIGLRGRCDARHVHGGVMDVLMENGVNFDGVTAYRQGAAFGCNYKSKADWPCYPL